LLAAASISALAAGGAFSAASAARTVHHPGHQGGVKQHGGAGHHSGGAHGGKSTITSTHWGTVDGKDVDLYTLSNGRMTVKISNYGGVVQSIWVRDRRGRLRDVALGFKTLQDYVNDFTQGATGTPWPLPGGSGDTYFGAIIGRYANRIANHSFTMSCSGCANNGTTYALDANNGNNTLHGGLLGWNTKVWTATPSNGPAGPSLQLTYDSPNGDSGFPAEVLATVTYSLTRANGLKITYGAVNKSSDLATVINLTNHTYFNLGGEGSGTVERQLLAINASRYQPVDTNLIPVGFSSVAGTPFDFRSAKPIGRDLRDANLPDGGGQPYPQLVITHGYDHNFVLNGSGYRLAALAEDPHSGITLATYTDQPGVQLYTGNFLVGDLVGPSGHTYRQTDAFTLETQHYPDSPHHIGDAGWPSVVLNPGQTFSSVTTYQFGTAGRRLKSRF
jgi:aldose 1-epimerase